MGRLRSAVGARGWPTTAASSLRSRSVMACLWPTLAAGGRRARGRWLSASRRRSWVWMRPAAASRADTRICWAVASRRTMGNRVRRPCTAARGARAGCRARTTATVVDWPRHAPPAIPRRRLIDGWLTSGSPVRQTLRLQMLRRWIRSPWIAVDVIPRWHLAHKQESGPWPSTGLLGRRRDEGVRC